MYILLAGLSHKTAPVDIREKCAFSRLRLREIYAELEQSEVIDGAVFLVTCNRTEVYATSRDVRYGLAALENILQSHSGLEKTGFAQYTYQYFSHHAIAHLFSVISGLDSMILGEHQIMGQMKDAYRTAVARRSADRVLHILFQKALQIGKKVRTETGINNYPVSVSSAAVELCQEIFESLEHKRVLVVGAGETGALVVKHLVSHGVESVIVSNRSFEHAVEMAKNVNGRAVHFDKLSDELENAHIVISCTAASHFVMRRENCSEPLRKRNGSEIVMIDIAVPRDIEPVLSDMPNVFLYDIDDLQNVVETNYKERLKAAHNARDIIECQATKLSARLATLDLVPVIKSLKDFADEVKQAELEKALKRLGSTAQHEETVVTSLANGIVKKLLHGPCVKLRQKAIDDQGQLYADIVKDLFGLGESNSFVYDADKKPPGQ